MSTQLARKEEREPQLPRHDTWRPPLIPLRTARTWSEVKNDPKKKRMDAELPKLLDASGAAP